MSTASNPPYVQFEVRAVENRVASEEAGHYVADDVVFAIVTPAGSRDRLEKVADDWIAGLEEGVKQERIPETWLHAYREALANFKKNQENPEFGTPLRDWAGLSPAQLRILQEANCRTVEELASANEELLGRIGMGAVALRDRAKAWLDSAESVGQTAAELENLRVANAALKADNEKHLKLLKELQSKVETLEAAAKK